MTEQELIKQFTKFYIDGSPCAGCKYENYGSCENRYKQCEERLKELLNDKN